MRSDAGFFAVPASVPGREPEGAKIPALVPEVPRSSQSAEPSGNRAGTGSVPAENPRVGTGNWEPLPGLSPRDRIDGFAALGLDVYLDEDDQLRARGRDVLVEAAHPVLTMHRDVLVAELRRRRSVIGGAS